MTTPYRLAAAPFHRKMLFIAYFLALTASHTSNALTTDEATTLAKQGGYQQAYDGLLASEDVSPRRDYTLAGLRLSLAQAAQNRGQLDEAAVWLHHYISGGGNPYPDLYTLVTNRQTELNLGNAVAHRYARELRVGVMVPLSGSLAGVGQSLLRAAQLAVFQQPYENLRLFPIDSRPGLDAFNTLQTLQVDMVLGPLLSQTAGSIKNAANRSSIPIIAFSSDREVAGEMVHLISYSPAQQARVMAQFAAQEGKTKLAALVPNTPYGKEVLNAFKDEAHTLGLEFLAEVFYDPTHKDLSPSLKELAKLKTPPSDLQRERNKLEALYSKQGTALDREQFKRLKELRRLKTEKTVTFDALFMPSAAESLPLITSQLVYNDMDSNNFYLLGTSLWNNPKALISRGEYMRHAYFPAPAMAPGEKFRNLYLQTYGQQPHPLAILAYDGVILASSALRDNTAFNLNAGLTPATGYYGASGAFRFSADGLAEHLYDLMQITPEGFIPYRPSPDAFLPPHFAATTTPENQGGHGHWFDTILPRY